MIRTQRRIGLLFLIALVLVPIQLFAQDEIPSAVGSAAVAPVLNALIDASGSPAAAAITVSITGTNTGVDIFCRGEADLVMANRALTPGDEAACSNSAVSYLELLAGYDGIALIAHPADTFVQCLTSADLRLIYAPGSTNFITNWTQVNPENPFQPLTLALPNPNTAAYNILNGLVGTDGLRTDATTLADDAAVIAQVSQNPGTLGVVRLNSALNAADVQTVELNTTAAGCIAPTVENIASGVYGGTQPFFIYANPNSLSKPGVTETLNVLIDTANGDLFSTLGVIPPTEDDFAGNANVMTNLTTGRQFSGEETGFSIPNTVSGQVLVAGSPSGNQVLTAWTSTFASQYPTVTVTSTLRGEPDGFRRLCNGEVDIIVAYEPLPAEEVENCSLNNIVVTTINLGYHAVGLIANAQSDYLQCLTTAQVAAVWGAASENTVTTWNQVSDTFPETPIILTAPTGGSIFSDVLLLRSGATPAIARTDVAEENADPEYRAAATANVEGAMTFFNWEEFQTVMDSGQTNIMPVSIDAGNGCVVPSQSTVLDDTYPLARPINLLINRTALARQDVQAFLWFLVQDASYGIVEGSGLVGLPISELPAFRSALETLFTEAAAEAAAQAINPEVTPEPGAEVTPEATAEATLEATADPSDADAQMTPEATAEATPISAEGTTAEGESTQTPSS